MYAPPDVELPPDPTPEELDRAAPWVRMAQEPYPDFSPYEETGFHVHGFSSHAMSRDFLRAGLAVHHGMISLLDHHVGRILQHLDERGLADDTLVVFTTDHGNYFGQHGLVAKGPFHYEDLIRVPFLARWPGRIPAGSAPAGLLSLVDLTPTFLGAAELPVPGWVQGVDQLPALTGSTSSVRDHVIVEDHFEPTQVHLRTYVEDRWKLTVYQGHPWGELYDLHDDPGEVRNRFDDPELAEVRARLHERFLDAELRREPLPTRRVANA
jgi:arylsulfatase A-like enzyme